MKRFFSLFISAVVLLSAIFAANAFTTSEYPGIVFINDYDDNFSVSGYTGDDSVLVVPETVYKKNVTRFDEKALWRNSVVESVIMNDIMTKVKQRAFYGCENLSYVYYSKKLEIIDDSAFSYNSSICSAFLGNTVIRQLGSNAYLNCENLKYVSLPDSLETINGAAFEKTALRKIVLPGKTKILGARSFAHNKKLKKLYVPASVTTIGTDILYGSDNVTVYTPEGSAMQTYCEEHGIDYKKTSEDIFPSRLPGDTNGDGEADVNDVTFIQRELAGYETDFFPDNCDIDGNCRLNINDAAELQYRIVGFK